MRTLIKLVSFAVFCLFATECFAEQVFWGIEYKQESVGSPVHKVFILKVDLQAKGIRPFVTPELNGSKMSTGKFVSTYGVQVGINTAFFKDTGQPIGYFCSEGKPYTHNYPDDSYPTIGFTEENEYLYGIENRALMFNAASGSTTLVKDGVAVKPSSSSFSTSTHPRTAVGIDKTGRYFYMIVVDGRSSTSTGMSFATLSDYMVKLGIYHGVNMDGGGSSTMIIQGKGLVNKPVGGTYQRPVASHLGFFANKDCTPSEELCNHIDDDCDGEVDEDGVCDPQCEAREEICNGVDDDCDGEVDEDGVCDPQCEAREEICNGIDDDCDGEVDEDGVCDSQCEAHEEICNGEDDDCDGEVDEDGVCDSQCEAREEICNGEDDDCDGEVDEEGVCDSQCEAREEICNGEDDDCDGEVDEDGVCDSQCEAREEICNGEDDDCDGEVDEDDVCDVFDGPGVNVHRSSDCTCSVNASPRETSISGILFMLCGLTGLMMRRKKRAP